MDIANENQRPTIISDGVGIEKIRGLMSEPGGVLGFDDPRSWLTSERLPRLDDGDGNGTVTIPAGQARALVAAGEVLTQLWGDLNCGEPLTLGDLNERMLAAGCATEVEGVPMLADELVDGIIDVGVCLAHLEIDMEADDVASDDVESDVSAAEASWPDDADISARRGPS